MGCEKKIAILGTRYSPPHFRGGEEHVIHYLDQHFTRRGGRVDVYTPQFRKWRDIDAASTAKNVVRVPVNDVRFLYHFQFAKRLPAYLKTRDYDVVVNTHAALGYKLCLRPHVVVVATTSIGEAQAINGWSPRKALERLVRTALAFRVEKSVFTECGHLICVNHHIRDEVVRLFGVPERKTSVVGNGVDSDFYCPPGDEASGRKPPFRILYVGRLVNRKNVELLVRSAAFLKGKEIAFEINVVGEGEERRRLESLAMKLGVDDRIVFLGRKARLEVLQRYQQSQVFVLPSRYEGMPLVLLEALSCGLPSVVSDFAGARDIVKDDFDGYVLKHDSPEELAGRLSQIARNPDLMLSMSRNARRLILDRFSWDAVINQYLEIIQRTGE